MLTKAIDAFKGNSWPDLQRWLGKLVARIPRVETYTVSLSSNVAANQTHDVALPVKGLSSNDIVAVSSSDALPAYIGIIAARAGDDTLFLRLCNLSGSSASVVTTLLVFAVRR